MWLLNAANFTLKHFDQPPARYATLSHVWQHDEDSPEQTFQAVQALRTPKPAISDKIRDASKHARAQGLNWIWIDTCCIDRTNNAELSEAVNSMFDWYAGATVCFAFLHDVSPKENPAAADSSFRKSRWFKRAWTLSELLAPRDVVFYAGDWTPLGTKAFFAGVLAEITGIDIDVLTFSKEISEVPVAHRMRWAAGRRATRVEDEAYSLLGIFDVKMVAIYGEGRRAFGRLQEEIMKTSTDHTFFVWGECIAASRLSLNNPARSSSPHSSSSKAGSFRERPTNLLASSPSSFLGPKGQGTPSPLLRGDFEDLLKTLRRGDRKDTELLKEDHSLPSFFLNGRGIRSIVPLIALRSECIVPANSVDTGKYYAAPLACGAPGSSNWVCLILCRAKGSSDLYEVGAEFKNEGFARYVTVDFSGPEHRAIFEVGAHGTVEYSWANIYIAQSASRPAEVAVQAAPSCAEGNSAQTLIIPRWNLEELEKQGFYITYPENPLVPKRLSVTEGFMYRFQNHAKRESFRIHVGVCADEGLWFTIEYIDETTGGALVAEHIHDVIEGDSPRPSLEKTGPPAGGCKWTHVRAWDTNPPVQQETDGKYPDPDGDTTQLAHSKLRWAHYRTFEGRGRFVNLRVVDSGADEATSKASVRGDRLWVLGIEIDPNVPWGEGEDNRISPPRKTTLSPRQARRRHATTWLGFLKFKHGSGNT